MFPNKSLLGKLSKLNKCKLENGKDGLFGFLGGKGVSQLNSPKMAVLSRVRCNGFQGELFPARKHPQVLGRSFSEGPPDGKCWKCKQTLELKDFGCASCGALQRPNINVNYFQLLGVSQMYEIDLDELTKKFRNLQMIFHPDKFANKSMEELEISETYSRLLNKAYTTLKDPISRGFYLLEIQKMASESFPLQQDFLMKVMERNEELDSIDKISVLNQFMETNNDEIKTQLRLIKEAFRCNKAESAKLNLMKLNYFMNLDNKIKEKQNSFNSPPDA